MAKHIPSKTMAQGKTFKILKVTRTNVYLVKLVGGGYDTATKQSMSGQSPFGDGEKASTGIDFRSHLAVVPVRRIHFGNNANDGHIVEVLGWRWVVSREEARGQLSGSHSAINAVEQYLKSLRSFVYDPMGDRTLKILGTPKLVDRAVAEGVLRAAGCAADLAAC